MRSNSQTGAVNTLLLPLLISVLLLIGAIIFAVWAYGGRQDYKTNLDNKVAIAVTAAKKAEDAVKEEEFTQRDKSPLKTYTGPSAYGSVVVEYPKSWSGYVSDSTDNDPFINGYFSPGVVPSTADEKSSFALRIQVVSSNYSEVLKEKSQSGSTNPVTVAPYALPKVPGTVGARLTGGIESNKQGVMIILPIRDKTLEVWTDSNQFISDLDTYILPNMSFAP